MARIGGNGALGMGIAFVLEDYFSDTASDIERAMGNLDESTERLARNAQNSFNLMVAGAGMVGASIGGLSIFKKASDVRAEFQAYEVQFETLLKSAERASVFMEKIKQDAIDNPIFGTEALVASNSALIATGNVSEEASRRITNNLAEVLAGAGKGNEELMRMSANLQQIANTGKASSVDIKQFGMAGIPIYKLLADSMGITQEQAMEMDVTLDQLDKAFEHAIGTTGLFAGAAERAAQSTKGLKASLEDGIELTMERIGKAIEPLTRRMYQMLGQVMDKVQEFASSEFGQQVLRWVAVGLSLLGVLGMLVIAYGASRLAIFKLIGMFGAGTKAMLIQTLATKGLTGALRQMAVATWSAVAPYLAIVAVVAIVAYAMYKLWDMITTGDERMAQLAVTIGFLFGILGGVVVLIAGIYRGFQELKKPIDEMATTGVIGFFTKLASMIEVVRQTWATWNGENAMLTADLYERLEKLGMVEWAEKLISLTTRVKQFFMGIGEALEPVGRIWNEFVQDVGDIFTEMFDSIKTIFMDSFNTLKGAFAPLMPLLEQIYDLLFQDSDISTWNLLGNVVGTIVVGAFNIFLDILKAVIQVIAWVIEAVVFMTTGFVTAFATILSWGYAFVVGFMNIISAIWQGIKDLVSRTYQGGVDFVTGLKNGIIDTWNGLVEAVSSRITKLVKMITEPIGGAFDFIKTGGGLWGDTEKPEGPNNNPSPKPRGGGGLVPNSSKIPFVSNTTNNTTNNGGGGQNWVTQVVLDGNIIQESLVTRQNLNNSRNG